MSRFSDEERASIMEKSRRLIEELDTMQSYEPAAEVVMAAPTPKLMQSFGQLPLRSSAPLDRWRREGEEWARKCKRADAAMKAHEAEYVRQRQAAARPPQDANGLRQRQSARLWE